MRRIVPALVSLVLSTGTLVAQNSSNNEHRPLRKEMNIAADSQPFLAPLTLSFKFTLRDEEEGEATHNDSLFSMISSAGVGRLTNQAGSLTDDIIRQRWRMRLTGRPVYIDRGSIFIWRDNMTEIKGVILKSFAGGRFDLGLYKQRFKSSENRGANFANDFINFFNANNPLVRDGKQIYLGLRFRF